MKLDITVGTQGQQIQFFLQDLTTGQGKTGQTANIAAWYRISNQASTTALTISSVGSIVGTWVAGGKVAEIANGHYTLDLPDAALSTGRFVVVHIYDTGSNNWQAAPCELQIVSYNPNNSVNLGLSALPSATAGGSGGLSLGSSGRASGGAR